MLTTVHFGCLRTNLLFPSWVHKELIWKLQIGPKAWHHGYTWNSNGYILLSLPFFGCVQQRAASLAYKFCYLCNTVGLKLWALFPVLLSISAAETSHWEELLQFVSNFIFWLIISKHYRYRSRGLRGVKRSEKFVRNPKLPIARLTIHP